MTGESQSKVVVLDVFGGDQGPDVILGGALKACDPKGKHAIDPARILLVGDEKRIAEGLQSLGGNPGFGILHASQVIGMDEKPAAALRSKRDSTIVVGTQAVRSGAAGAFVSMGSTGAVVGAGTLMLRTLEGVRRPAIAVTLELTGKPLTILDMGANIAATPEDLVAYGVMGSVLQSHVLDVPTPRVGLLNIGEEPGKGTDLLKETYGMMGSAPLEFTGNIEGADLFNGSVDVVVTDGFTGNICLKLMEGMAGFMLGMFSKALAPERGSKEAQALGAVHRKVDYSEYGGALLLGVKGTVVIGHGRSDENAVSNALGLATRALDREVNRDIVAGMAAVASAN
ncbi:MAG: glycerol-3-phosphate acyltransferase PlsX [Planctomycetota bacterium]|jgi:glycerol-3-phosphate acyltransferase PlsX